VTADCDRKFMRVIDMDTMQLRILDVNCSDYKRPEVMLNNSLEWYDEVYMIGARNIHVITKDCKKYNCIKNLGFRNLM
jgi:hypothetical protein